MKKLGIAFAIAMAALMIIASPAMAWGGSDANADVDCSDIDVTDDSPVVGTIITFSGTVTIAANSNTSHWISTASAWSNAWYTITDPNGVDIYSGGNFKEDDGTWWFGSSADAGQVYDWYQDVYIDIVGDYIAEHGGEAYAEYEWWLFFWSGSGSASADCSSSRTVTSHALTASASYIHPYLVINLPGGSRHFYSSDGWGDPTTQGIVYTDGTWQVEISDGTAIQLDGSWHKTTYLDVDDQGNVTGGYDAGGSTIAEDIGLSQPITITKLG